MKTLSDDFQVISAAGVVIRTFAEREAAIKWTKANSARLPGLTVEHVVRHETRFRVYRPRPAVARLEQYA